MLFWGLCLALLVTACIGGSDPAIDTAGDGDGEPATERDGDDEADAKTDGDEDRELPFDGDFIEEKGEEEAEADFEPDGAGEVEELTEESTEESDEETLPNTGSINGSVLSQALYMDLPVMVFLFDSQVDLESFPAGQALTYTMAIPADGETSHLSFAFKDLPPGSYYIYAETRPCHFLFLPNKPALRIAYSGNPVSLKPDGSMHASVDLSFMLSDLSCRTMPAGTGKVEGLLLTQSRYLGRKTHMGLLEFVGGKRDGTASQIAQVLPLADPQQMGEDKIVYSFVLTDLPSSTFQLVAWIDRDGDGNYWSLLELLPYAHNPIELAEGQQLSGFEFFAALQDPALSVISGSITTQADYLTSLEYIPSAFLRNTEGAIEQFPISLDIASDPNPQTNSLSYKLINIPDGPIWINTLVDRCPASSNTLWGEIGMDYADNPITVDSAESQEITGIDFDFSTEDLLCPGIGDGVISGSITAPAGKLTADGYTYIAWLFDEEASIGIQPLTWSNGYIKDFEHPEILSFIFSDLPADDYYLAVGVEVCFGPGEGEEEWFAFFPYPNNPLSLDPEHWRVSDADFDLSNEALACSPPEECEGDEGNELGVGKACTPGGTDCPEGLLCAPDAILDAPALCILMDCTGDGICGSEAVCLDAGVGMACVPERCLQENTAQVNF